MNLRTLRKLIAVALLSALTFSVFIGSGVAAQGDEDYPEDIEIPEITPGVLGALAGVFVAIWVRYKWKETELKEKGILGVQDRLKFNLKKYGTAGIVGIVLDIFLQVGVPAMVLGSRFTSGDPILDFVFGFLAGYGCTELIKKGMNKLAIFESLPPARGQVAP